jgi:hypothetical protein
MSQARGETDNLYPHSCRHCENLVIDTRRLRWIYAMRLRYGLRKSLPLLITVGMTVAEAQRASQYCSFFRSIVTRGHEHEIPFRNADKPLYWWLHRFPHKNGFHQVDVAPLDRDPVGSEGFMQFYQDSMQYSIYALRGKVAFLHWPCPFWLTLLPIL